MDRAEIPRLNKTYPAGTIVYLDGAITGRLDYWSTRAGRGVVAVVFVDHETVYGHVEVAAKDFIGAFYGAKRVTI